MNGYELSRVWFDWCFINPEKIKPNHSALYFFCIEHCNRLGWKEKFGLPTTMAMEALGMKSYNTYKDTLNNLVEWGFIKMIEKSKNQYSANIVALSNFNKAVDKALDKALIKHALKQSESIDSIDKQITINKEQSIDDVIKPPSFIFFTIRDFEEQIEIGENEFTLHAVRQTKKTVQQLKEFYKEFILAQKALTLNPWKSASDAKKHFIYWVNKQPIKLLPSQIRKVHD